MGSGGRQIHEKKLELDDFISVTPQRVELRGREMVDDLPRRAPLPTITITIMRGQIDFAFRSTCSTSTLQIGRVKVSLPSMARLPIGRILGSIFQVSRHSYSSAAEVVGVAHVDSRPIDRSRSYGAVDHQPTCRFDTELTMGQSPEHNTGYLSA